MATYMDSVDKIVRTYFASVTKHDFVYKGKTYTAKPLKVAPGILLAFECVSGCGACCRPFTLDWLPSEPRNEATIERMIEVDGKTRLILTYPNSEKVRDKWGIARCGKQIFENGWCGIHTHSPFSCDFEVIRFTMWPKVNYLSNRYFGRGWSYTKIVDGSKRAGCKLHPPTEEARAESVRKLIRLKTWTDYFELDTHLPAVIDWVKHMPLDYTRHMAFYPDSNEGVIQFFDDETPGDIVTTTQFIPKSVPVLEVSV